MGKKRATVGVVDDDAGVRTALHQLLRSAGYHARTFASAEEFLAVDDGEGVDFLIVDVNLPGMTGVALLRTLGERGVTLPSVFITGRDDATTADLRRQAPLVPWLSKPFNDVELFAIIHAALESPR